MYLKRSAYLITQMIIKYISFHAVNTLVTDSTVMQWAYKKIIMLECSPENSQLSFDNADGSSQLNSQFQQLG